MNRTRAPWVAGCVAVAALASLSGCDEKKAEAPPAPAPAPAPAVPPPPPTPAPAAEPARPAAEPVEKAPAAAKQDAVETPPIEPRKVIEAPAEVKEKVAKGMDEKVLDVKKGGRPLPPPPPPVAETPTAAPARDAVPAGRPGRGIPAAFAQGTDAGK